MALNESNLEHNDYNKYYMIVYGFRTTEWLRFSSLDSYKGYAIISIPMNKMIIII